MRELTWMRVRVGLALITAKIWALVLMSPLYWLRTENSTVSLKLNLFTVSIQPGVGIPNPGSPSQFEKLFDQKLWLSDASSLFCEMRMHGYCADFEKVVIGSWAMLICGTAAGVSLLAGGSVAAYYAHAPATDTSRSGRTWIRRSFSAAPLFAWLGIGVYSMATMAFGKANSMTYWSLAWMIAIFLAFLSMFPALITAFFDQSEPSRKRRCEIDMLVEREQDGR
eukprot:CAMPEP_0180646848 /NCGR_PEP_ID=MMETSP1037_2-20121125/49933_1 /TAXON_ID=632150 /ORGANISM="Azadinium spinosum, Strain 3D9" /LENGTH=223 /DNA_ID=CAMNT_0022671183 /DNA_START=54 /DNA_END=721 /DNA_ORIENTATION=+